jgi:HK97 family phage major capsid protein
MKFDELRNKVTELRDEIESLAAIETISPEDDARLSAALEEFEVRKAELVEAEARAARIEAAKATITERSVGFDAPQVMRKTNTDVDVRTASRSEVRDAALKLAEQANLSARQESHVEKLLSTRSELTDGAEIAKRLVLTENPHYRTAFMKSVTQTNPAFTSDEVEAVNEFRAMSHTLSAGGAGVPVTLDPTIILTSGAADAPILNVARVVTITTDKWQGVSSAGVSWSYDAEGSESSDDSPTLAQPEVQTYTARGTVPFSIEIGQDYPGFAEEMRRLLERGYIDLIASQTMTGATPVGIFTALDANTNVEVIVTSDGVLQAADILKVWSELPERYRSRATWVMHTSAENEVRKFAASSDGAYYTVNLAAGGVGTLMGRPIIVSDYAPEFTGTTGAANILVVGDFSEYLIAQRAGMTVELVSHLLGTTNGLPTGQRAWFAYARHGFDSVNDSAFRILQND